MNIREHSSQFTVFLFSSDVDLGASCKVALSQAGYDAYYFQNLEDLLGRVKENPPHIVIFSTASLQGTLSQFVQDILAISEEIKFISISNISQFDILAQYNNIGLEEVVSEEIIGIESRVVWATDKSCERLYWQYQNEFLLKKNQELQKNIENLEAKLRDQSSRQISDLSLSLRVNDYLSAGSKEEIIQKFMNNTTAVKSVFFKFLPSVRSFVATHSQGFPLAAIQGVGTQLSNEELKDLPEQISVGLLPPSFANMLVQAFRLNPPKGWPLYAGEQLEGIVVYNGAEDTQRLQLASEEFSLLRLTYSHFALEKRIDALEILDPATEALNKVAYWKELEGEFDRARRLKNPLSLVKVSIDDFFELEHVIGTTARDSLLKSIVTLIQKTSRSHDKTARTAENELAMILPHCSRKGAAIRAERVRRIIESSQLIDNGIKVTVSLGISEYPMLCRSTTELDQSASKALHHIVERGGNKICLYKAPTEHQPEFHVEAE